MDIKGISHQVKGMISERRYVHTVNVAKTSVKLAVLYGEDPAKAETAALLHDIARDIQCEQVFASCRKYGIIADEVEKAVPELLHGKIGALIAREKFGVTDAEVLDAIRFHTTGRRGMSTLEKIVFIADMIEPERDYPGVGDLRELAVIDLNRSVVAGLNSTIRYVLERNLLIHPSSIEARNSLLHPDCTGVAGTDGF